MLAISIEQHVTVNVPDELFQQWGAGVPWWCCWACLWAAWSQPFHSLWRSGWGLHTAVHRPPPPGRTRLYSAGRAVSGAPAADSPAPEPAEAAVITQHESRRTDGGNQTESAHLLWSDVSVAGCGIVFHCFESFMRECLLCVTDVTLGTLFS